MTVEDAEVDLGSLRIPRIRKALIPIKVSCAPSFGFSGGFDNQLISDQAAQHFLPLFIGKLTIQMIHLVLSRYRIY